ncbi:MAG: EscU/YscU/HrcU family type III secretion system export apparatus switch protein, partial [Pseudomonas caspiana]
MAENENGQDKTEDPTDKKVRDSRAEGQIARSKELNTLAIMMAGAIGLLVEGADIAQAMSYMMTSNFSITREVLMDQGSMGRMLLATGKLALVVMMPFLLVMLASAVIGPISLGGWLFAT